MRATDLYRHFNAKGELLYVGVSIRTLVRLGQHRENSCWYGEISDCKIEHFDTREAALAAEKAAIENEQPRYNVHHKVKVVPLKQPREMIDDLLSRLVKFDSVYSLEGAARVLCLKSPSVVLRLIQSGQLGSIQLPPRNEGGKPKTAVSGWQLLEYIEALENASQARVA
jgi:hypothetical protein